MLSGIPQGSVLGLALFVIYLNSMPNTVRLKLYLFADDAKLYIEITSNRDVELLQDDLRKLEKWSKNNLLHFNEDNCVHMITSNGRSNRETRSYELYDKQLEMVGEGKKNLGVIIGSKLSFDSHIFAKVRKTNSIIAVLKKFFPRKTIPVFLNVYEGLIRARLEFGLGTCVWYRVVLLPQ